MGIISKLICLIWSVALLALLSAPVAVVASDIAASTTAYDHQTQLSNAYDGTSAATQDYDSAPASAENKKRNGTVGTGGALAGFVEFLAAKGVEQGRDALGRFLPKAGGEVVPGSMAEQAVWDAINQKPGWSVIEGRVSVRNATKVLPATKVNRMCSPAMPLAASPPMLFVHRCATAATSGTPTASPADD